jgi:hypothetical protein
MLRAKDSFVLFNFEDVFTRSRNTSGSLSAKLQSGRPEGQTSYPSIQFYIMPLCSYQISISISWVELFGQV